MDESIENEVKRNTERNKEEGSEGNNETDAGLPDSRGGHGIAYQEDEGGSESDIGGEDEGNAVPSDLQKEGGSGVGGVQGNGSSNGGGQETSDGVTDTVSRYIPMDVQREEPPIKSSNSVEQILRERIGTNNNKGSTGTSTNTGSTVRGQGGQESTDNSAFNRLLQRKLGVTSSHELSQTEILSMFRKLPLDVRMQEAVKTFAEFRDLQKKYSSVMDTFALMSDKYKQAVTKKKPMERIVEKIVDMFDRYMSVNLSDKDKDKLRNLIQEVLSEDEAS